MGAFEYTALNANGKNVRGTLHGDTDKQIRQLLRDQDLIPLSVEATAKQINQSARNIGGFRRMKASDLILFTRQLATMIQAGEPLDSALDSIAQEFNRTHARKVISSIRSAILEGQGLADALQQFERQFPDFYIATIGAGEHSGNLGLILERLADYMEYRQQHQQKMLLSLMYPMIVSAVALLVIVALMTYVVPQVVTVYENIDQQLPWLTQTLIATSTFLKTNLLFLAAASVAIMFATSYLYRIEHIRFRVHQVLLHIPLAGPMARSIQVTRFSRTLSILLASGVGIIKAIHISSNVVNLLPMKKRIEAAAKQVREGLSVRRALGDTKDFPAMSLQLISSGENSGKLDDMLERAAQSQEREIELKLSTLLGLFEPLLILFMGGFVLMIVLAILLPIFDLNQMVQVS